MKQGIDAVDTYVYTTSMNTTTIQKWGNSLGIRIPKEVAHKTRMREGSIISLSVEGETLTLKHSKKPSYTLKSLLKDFDKKTRHAEVDWGPARGSEVW